ncbi:hypothetical protein [Marinobacterium rhizophilum]|uniref:Uncharacterized protein n=1 Tax=Marinobacterium rhizophilum TaxID=420402 RepID=A0ABY5HND2_9GAMM|nr:hypothetical protein [Marinobacterium rhizophilum]UTW13083.1 hypothetical protein KDW95_05325 [Marinobacterium rhizophilum]
MNIDNLPVDNLYKFIALSGLVLTLFSFFYVEPLLREQSVEIAKLNAEVGFYKSKNPEEIKSTYTIEKQVEIEIRIAELKERNLQIKELNSDAKTFLYFGGFLMLLGFNLWYLLVQRPKDKILKNEAKNNP